jgi:hypothetical protein
MPETQTDNPPTFESVWALVKEIAESQKETERVMKEDTQRLKEELDKKIGAITNLFGDLTEAMVAPKICEKFNEFGFSFLRATTESRFNDKINDISFEADIMLENSDKAMLIEVKTKLTDERIDKHVLRLEKMRKYADLHGDKRTFLGAVAGVVMTSNVKEYALGQGFYVVEPSGETFNITPPGGKPKEW